MLDSAPWVWLGGAQLWHRLGGAEPSTWLPLLDRAAASEGAWREAADRHQVPWEPALLDQKGRRQSLPDVGRKLGLGTPGDVALERLHGHVLHALAERLEAAPVLVTPPSRAPMLTRLRDAGAPLAGIVLTADMLGPGEQPLGVADDEGYLPDWQQPRQLAWAPRAFLAASRRGIDGDQVQLPPPPRQPPRPAMISIADFRAGRPRPLAVLGPKVAGRAPGLSAHAEVRLDLASGAGEFDNRPAGVGLVWAWGFGREMWQPALPPTPLPDSDAAAWLIRLGPGLNWTLQALDDQDQPLDEEIGGVLQRPVLGDPVLVEALTRYEQATGPVRGSVQIEPGRPIAATGAGSGAPQ